jgi:spore photoproduct lyase
MELRMQVIYIEKSLINHPRAINIIKRFKRKTVITCNHYGEIFNRKKQSFRQQKENPALIIAEKKGKRVLETPPNFGIGGNRNFYFSHLLNCPFDCRYCFLQGMYQSAHYLLFINYEDFMNEIKVITEESLEPTYFFSGYDSDSLAYEPITQFIGNFLPFFSKHPKAILELRSKSANVKELLKYNPPQNCIVAYSLNPEVLVKKVEHKTASLEKRLNAIKALADHGYRIGLRFDPLIYDDKFYTLYDDLLQKVKRLNIDNKIHSISTGILRFPEKMHQKIIRNYPNDKLLNQVSHKRDKQVSYSTEKTKEMQETIHVLLSKYFPNTQRFSCHNESLEV